MLIVLWGLADEDPLTLVQTELDRLGLPYVFLDQRQILATEVELSVGQHITGYIQTPQWTIDLNSVTALYLRPYESTRLPQVTKAGDVNAALHHANTVDDLLIGWAELTPALVINRPSAMAPNNSKPYQLEQIRRLGFQVPDTLITTDPTAVHSFLQRHTAVIYKSISGVRSRVSRLKPEHLERFVDVTWCPTQFQQYIPGKDYRVHVIGETIFACEITAQADDYRYVGADAEAPEILDFSLPEAVAAQCQRLAIALNLTFAGIDLRCTPDGEWYCFEVNPSPGYSYYQRATGQPISTAVAQVLAQASSRTS
jgi:hypothetical protein